MKRLMKRLAVIAGPIVIAGIGLAIFAPRTWADLNTRARATFAAMFDASGYVGWPVYAADPFTCDSTHLPSSSRPAVHYWNSASGHARVCDGTSWRIASMGTAGSVTTTEILDGTIANADISASAAIARSKLAEDALQVNGIPISAIMSSAGASLLAAETAGTFDVTVGTNTILANGEVTDNETETSVAYFQFVLPPEYVSAGDVTIRLPAALIATGAPTDNGTTLDIEVYEQSDAGAVGSDINSTAAATFAALDTWYNKDFVVTATGLVAGDVLNVKITASVIDSEAGAGTIVLNLAPPKVLIDIKG